MSRGSGRLHVVVMAGGAGERFWPRSRRSHPKPLLRVVDDVSLLEATLRRAQRVAPADRTWIVAAGENVAPIRSAAKLPRGHVLAEPTARNTAMAAGFAAARLVAEDPEAVLAMLPADHVIPDARAHATALRRAARAAGDGALVTLGVKPTRPDPGYGYIQRGAAVGDAHPGLYRVRRFVEKPSPSRARGYLRRGGYFWNAGIFVWRAASILEEIERWAPDLHRALGPVRKRPAGRGSRAARERAYRRAPSLPIDVAVMERSDRVWTHPVDFHWSDVGNWASLAQELGVTPQRSRVIGGEALLEEAPGNLVYAADRLVALLGVEGLAVVDAGDALLVTTLDRSGDVKRVVARLRETRRRELL